MSIKDMSNLMEQVGEILGFVSLKCKILIKNKWDN